MSKILLFGADGFIGKNLVESFRDNKTYSLTCLTKKDCDLLKFREVSKALNHIQPDFVINAAYIGVSSNIDFSEDYLFNNLKITTNILRSCVGQNSLCKIFFFGSGLEYGDSDFPISEDMILRPQNIYAGIKAANSILALSLAKHWGIPLIILRPFNLYGPHDRKNVIYSIIDAIRQKKKVILTAGEQIRDYLYIEDFCELMIRILENYRELKNFETYNIGSGEPVKLKEIFNTIFKVMKIKPKYEIVPYGKDDYMHQVADIGKIQSKISWNPKTGSEEGLKKTIKWVIYQKTIRAQ